ncbi:MAG TPA: hypothetical protein VIC84_23060 [Blastocatellia bacterium]|jgi:hypothetical protein
MSEANGHAQAKFEHWCLVELFGHQRIAGFVSEATIGGGAFIRVDVPNPHGEGDLYTRYFGPAAIYAINPTTKEEVFRLVGALHPKPPTPRVSEQRQLTTSYDPEGPDPRDDDDDSEEDDDEIEF